MSNFVADFRSNGRLWALLVAALVLCFAGSALAEDDRPKEMPYEAPGEFPQLSPDYKGD